MTTRRKGVESAAPVILSFLDSTYPDVRIVLDFRTPFQLLVSTVLAAQCTDDRVNRVTPGLFAHWPDAAAMSGASQEAMEEAVRSTGFYRNKAKAIRELSAALVSRHGGEVPADLEAWWRAFQGADTDTRKAMLLPDTGPHKRRRRRRKKRPAAPTPASA
jgi:endonuclease III